MAVLRSTGDSLLRSLPAAAHPLLRRILADWEHAQRTAAAAAEAVAAVLFDQEPTSQNKVDLVQLLPAAHLGLSKLRAALDLLFWPLEVFVSAELVAFRVLLSNVQTTVFRGMLQGLHVVLSSRMVLRLVWAVALVVSWARLFSDFWRIFGDPTYLYRLPFMMSWRTVKALWRLVNTLLLNLSNRYEGVLATVTSICSRLGVVGDVLLVPATVLWVGLPALAAWALRSRALVPLTVVGVCALVVRSRGIVAQNWR